MTHSPLTNEIRLSDQSSSRNGATIDTFLPHHLAGTNAEVAVDAMISGADGGSANYVITNEGKIILVVDEDLRAHASGSLYDDGKGAAWDRRSITVEIENETAGPDWTISDAALDAAAALLRDLRSRYNIVRTIGHRDLYTAAYGYASYPTYCPGPGTVAAILERADAPNDADAAAPALTIWQRQESEYNMPYLLKCEDNEGRYAGKPVTFYILVEPDAVSELHSITEANNLSVRFGDAVSVTYGTFERRLGGKPTIVPVP